MKRHIGKMLGKRGPGTVPLTLLEARVRTAGAVVSRILIQGVQTVALESLGETGARGGIHTYMVCCRPAPVNEARGPNFTESCQTSLSL